MTMSLRKSEVVVALGVMALVAIAGPSIAAGATKAPDLAQSAITGSPTAVSANAATLNGSVMPGGTNLGWFFQYGSSTDYGNQTGVGETSARDETVPVAVRVVGLASATVYHYRLVVRNDAGTMYGSDASFRTGAVPARIAQPTVAAVRDTSAVVDATVVPNGLPTKVYVRFGTTAGFIARSSVRSAAGDAPVALTFGIGGLSPNSTYEFDVVAVNAGGTRISAEDSFVTTGAPTIVSESAGSLGTMSANLGGTVNPDGHPTIWYVQYGATAGYGSRSAVFHLGPSKNAITVGRAVAGLDPNTIYHFRLVAKNSAGDVTGVDTTFTTLGPTLSASIATVIVGRSSTLSGTVPGALANQVVTIYAQATNSPSFVQVASVLTGTGGSWGYKVFPEIGTAYKAVWDDEISPTIGLTVRPSVRLRELLPGTFYTRVIAGTTFSGRMVRLERLIHGRWRTVAFAHLGRTSTAMLRPRKPVPGLSRLRVFFSAYQAGSGYLAGTSRVVHSRHG